MELVMRAYVSEVFLNLCLATLWIPVLSYMRHDSLQIMFSPVTSFHRPVPPQFLCQTVAASIFYLSLYTYLLYTAFFFTIVILILMFYVLLFVPYYSFLFCFQGDRLSS
jgi:hypothetical protein